jgi:hypothetical protein
MDKPMLGSIRNSKMFLAEVYFCHYAQPHTFGMGANNQKWQRDA